MSKTFVFTFIFFLLATPRLLFAEELDFGFSQAPVQMSDSTDRPVAENNVLGVQTVRIGAKDAKQIPLFSGYGISADLCGFFMAQVGKWGQYEVAAHVGIQRRYFPTVELGIGTSDYTADRSGLHYNIHSPYFRVGMDYSLNKNRASRNRYFLGLRYAFSSFSYDLDGPAITDDYWPYEFEYRRHGTKGNMHWGEMLFGIQTQLWKFIHCGWTIRYKFRFHEKQGEPGHAYYVPGYGKNGTSSSCFGGTFMIVFEL